MDVNHAQVSGDCVRASNSKQQPSRDERGVCALAFGKRCVSKSPEEHAKTRLSVLIMLVGKHLADETTVKPTVPRDWCSGPFVLFATQLYCLEHDKKFMHINLGR